MKTVLKFATLSLMGLAASGAMAQQGADTWTGAYVSLFAGETLNPNDSSDDGLVFDTNLDGSYGDTVFTAAGANAFSPGPCSGRANGPTPAAGCSSNDGGSDFGLRAGYDMQWNDWVFGVLGEYAEGDVTDAVSSFSTTPAFYTMTRELDFTLAMRGRVGYVFGGDSANLVYATAGIARVRFDKTYATSNAVNTFMPSGDSYAYGDQWGIGYERRLNANLSLGIEYLVSRFHDDDYMVRATGPAPATNPFIRVNAAGTDQRRSDRYLSTENVRVTAGWRF